MTCQKYRLIFMKMKRALYCTNTRMMVVRFLRRFDPHISPEKSSRLNTGERTILTLPPHSTKILQKGV